MREADVRCRGGPEPEGRRQLLQAPVPSCNYLIASMCDRDVFEHLKNYAVTMWHCGGELNGEDILDGIVPKSATTLAGGVSRGLKCVTLQTVWVLRATSLRFDSCIELSTEPRTPSIERREE